MTNLCDECETVTHCLKHGCIPKKDFWDGYVPEPTRPAPVQEKWGASAVMNPDYVAAQKEKTQQALDVMAENARELGLDYEPVWNNLPSNKDVEDAMRMKRLNQLATRPAAQRQWVGLTDEEMTNCLDAADQMYCERDGDKELFKGRAIEAELKEKNQ
jgi:hypothetical protein